MDQTQSGWDDTENGVFLAFGNGARPLRSLLHMVLVDLEIWYRSNGTAEYCCKANNRKSARGDYCSEQPCYVSIGHGNDDGDYGRGHGGRGQECNGGGGRKAEAAAAAAAATRLRLDRITRFGSAMMMLSGDVGNATEQNRAESR